LLRVGKETKGDEDWDAIAGQKSYQKDGGSVERLTHAGARGNWENPKKGGEGSEKETRQSGAPVRNGINRQSKEKGGGLGETPRKKRDVGMGEMGEGPRRFRNGGAGNSHTQKEWPKKTLGA